MLDGLECKNCLEDVNEVCVIMDINYKKVLTNKKQSTIIKVYRKGIL